jgi:hypothetical protein
MESLDPDDVTYFESICRKTATDVNLKMSLYLLSHFLRRRFGRKVIVLIDEYEVPIHRALEHDYFNEVCALYFSL